MLERVLETEAMDTPEEAVDYDSMDHSKVNRLFVADLAVMDPGDGVMLDLGTGTALIPIEICRRIPGAKVLAIDVAENMIALAKKNVEAAGLTDQISLELVDAKGLPFDDGQFATVISNSIVHHIPEPRTVLAEIWRVAAPGGLVFIRDLLRPESDDEVCRLVELYAGDENEHQRQMFDDSLRAALSVEEMRELVESLGCDGNTVTATSDRHWTWAARR